MNSECFANLAGMRAVVTGSTSGIGRAIASELSRGGADVIVHGCRNFDAANELASQLQADGKQARVVTCMPTPSKRTESIQVAQQVVKSQQL